MKIPPDAALTLLHEATHGTLATHARQMPGYPYATVLPYALDEAHRPVLCVSALAEHTRNLEQDARVSLSVQQPRAADVQDAPRLTMVADAQRFEPDTALLARYLRYQPSAESHLTLDFMFFRLQPRRVRFIGSIGRMGWLEDSDWSALPQLPTEDETRFLQEASTRLAPHIRLLGADCFGIDYEMRGERHRQRFPDAPLEAERFMELAIRIATGIS